MSTRNQSAQEANRSQEFQNNLRLLDGISSWHVWVVGAVVLLLSVSTLSLFFVAPGVIWALRGLLALVSILSAAFLYQQRHRLALLRSSLIAQIDAAARARATADKFYGMATVDELTRLYNRRFGETRLKEEIERAEKSGEPLILVALDFDKFKQINDTYGHAAGDLALKAFSRRLQRAIRACDVPIRVGGDEFLVIFPDCPFDKIAEILSRLDSIFFDFGGKKIPVMFSQGIAQYEVADTPEKMIQRADARLYGHKEMRKSAAGAPSAHARTNEATKEESSAPNIGEAHSDADAIETRNSISEEPAISNGTNLLDMEPLFRRSRRVDFERPVNVHVHNENGNEAPVVEKGKTVNVNAHGALLALNAPMEIGQKIRLVNPRTQQEIDCCVRRLVMPTPDGMVQVGVEFTAVAPTFWDISAPPLDWDPAWHPAPERQRTEPPENPAPGSAMDWGNDTYDARSSQPVLDPAWFPAREGQPALPSSSTRAVSSDMWAELDSVVRKALKEFDAVPRHLPVPVKEKPKRKRANKPFALGLIVAVCCAAIILVIMPRKSVARLSSASGQDSAHSEHVAEAASLPSTSNPSAPRGESSSGVTAALAEQAGMPAEVAQGVPDAAGFSLATKEDFDPAAVSWLETQGQKADVQIPGNYTGFGESHAYLLRRKDKSWRVLIISDGRVCSDVRFRNVAVVARVPKEYMRSIQLNEPTPPEFDGDGLLIVGSADKPATGVLLSLHGSDASQSHPADYRQIRLSDAN